MDLALSVFGVAKKYPDSQDWFSSDLDLSRQYSDSFGDTSETPPTQPLVVGVVAVEDPPFLDELGVMSASSQRVALSTISAWRCSSPSDA